MNPVCQVCVLRRVVVGGVARWRRDVRCATERAPGPTSRAARARAPTTRAGGAASAPAQPAQRRPARKRQKIDPKRKGKRRSWQGHPYKSLQYSIRRRAADTLPRARKRNSRATRQQGAARPQTRLRALLSPASDGGGVVAALPPPPTQLPPRRSRPCLKHQRLPRQTHYLSKPLFRHLLHFRHLLPRHQRLPRQIHHLSKPPP